MFKKEISTVWLSALFIFHTMDKKGGDNTLLPC